MTNAQRSSDCCDLTEVCDPGFFRSLADPNRLAILTRLALECRPQSVRDVAGCCTTDYSVVSRHLATLRDAGLIEARKEGREVLYTVNYDVVVRSLRAVADALEGCCPSEKREAK